MKYYIGVDGGGTKTAICAVSDDFTFFGSKIIGSASWREHGIDCVIKNIKGAVNSFPIDTENIAGLTIGIPCYGESGDGDKELEKAVREAFPGDMTCIINDVEVGWAVALGLSPGISVVAGTGSIAFGKNESGSTMRSGGWSEFFSDEGSCYWIGRKTMELFAKQSDGRHSKDELYEAVRSELGLNCDIGFIDLMHNEYINSRDKTASLQLITKKAALAGSVAARSIYKEAANELCLMVTAIRDGLKFMPGQYLVSYSGGLFKSGDLILMPFLTGIKKAGGKPVPPRFEPMHGALLMAFEKFNAEGIPALIKRLEDMKGKD